MIPTFYIPDSHTHTHPFYPLTKINVLNMKNWEFTLFGQKSFGMNREHKNQAIKGRGEKMCSLQSLC